MIAVGPAAASNDRHPWYAWPFRYVIRTLTEPQTQSLQRATNVTPVRGIITPSRFAEHRPTGLILRRAGQHRDARGTAVAAYLLSLVLQQRHQAILLPGAVADRSTLLLIKAF